MGVAAIAGAAVALLAVLAPLLLSIRAVEIEIARLGERVAHLGERVVRIESALTGPYRLPVPEPERGARDAPPAEPAPAREAART